MIRLLKTTRSFNKMKQAKLFLILTGIILFGGCVTDNNKTGSNEAMHSNLRTAGRFFCQRID